MRLAIAGIHIESGTFTPLRSTLDDFLATRGDAQLERYPFLAKPEFSRIEPVPLAHFRALPGGSIAAEAYRAMKDEILTRLDEAEKIDAFYFDIHGAMTVEGLDDAEADLLAAIRSRLPEGLPVTCSQDLHGNVSDELVAMTDVITTYRTAPHLDWMETRERAVRLLLRRIDSGIRPLRARVGIPVLVSGEMSSTTTEPGRSLHAPLDAESGEPGIWDASLWVGYAWADQKRAMASAIVTGEDEAAVRALAERIAQRYWNARHDFHILTATGSAEECLDRALATGHKAVFLSDAGDNPTAGAAGDVPDTLGVLLRHPAFQEGGGATAIFASIPDQPAIDAIRRSVPGEILTLDLGGKLDPVHGSPLRITARLESFHDGESPQAVLRSGGVRLIVTGKRRAYHLRNDFLSLGLEPLDAEVTVVKIGYLEPELAAMASEHFLVVSPGGVPPLLETIPYRHLQRPMFPLDRDFEWKPRACLFGG